MLPKDLKEWKDKDFWDYSLQKYRISKTLRRLLRKDKEKGFMYSELAKNINETSDYIYQMLIMNLKPKPDFIEKLGKEHENENQN
jgi:hypothetical protein